MIILEILIVCVVTLIVASIVNAVEDYHTRTSLIRLSFTDNMGKLNLPIVSLTNNGQSFNFLVDTGSTFSIVDSVALDKFEYSKKAEVGTAYGIDGKIIPVEYADIKLTSDKTVFEDSFQILRMDAFDNIRETEGVEIVGILGSTFLKRYNFIVDFKDLIIYKHKE